MSDWPRVISRHTTGQNLRWMVRGDNLNAWCKLPGSILQEGVVLVPNNSSSRMSRVTYEPTSELHADRFTAVLRGGGEKPHANVLRGYLFSCQADGTIRDEWTAEFRHGDERTLSVDLGAAGVTPRIGIGVTLLDYDDSTSSGHLSLRYALAHPHERLDVLFNQAGSDKGTGVSFGGGVPHCYSIAYASWFGRWQQHQFNMLEIGLQNAPSTHPTDAPSLRVWREFFPNAVVYGFDVADFSFYEADRTSIFQGDQASRDDWRRFLRWSGHPCFRLILDDGSHASSHQQISLASMFHSIEPGGLYVIEDLHWQPFEEVPTTLDVLRGFRDGGKVRSPFMEAHEIEYLERTIESVMIARPNDSPVAFVRKRRGVEGAWQ